MEELINEIKLLYTEANSQYHNYNFELPNNLETYSCLSLAKLYHEMRILLP